ncbi:concanavalin A-like lectin/glucanase domain-containing protein [Syncephalastrum racemosum]|uniref:Concanavalin A-like lectin/glucanase domain-containing protein n=1 Tax=Syncephalastrum racemosum TaxID=13706 RepID=A0A1X2HES1_SYNRA|nr:concanavalin A-like lectin/glucanase domain-containing protein [Syncephalastrum racemosum]
MSSTGSALGLTMHHFTGPSSSSYSTAFPPLQSFPWSFPHHKKHAQHGSQQTAFRQSLAPPKYPSYLKHTLYASLALEQYHYLQNLRIAEHTKPTSSSSSSSATSVDLRLPTCWNQKDKSNKVEIGRNGLDLTYIAGPGKTESHAASVRANFPMRPQCGVYYFEMCVLSKGNDGFIGIGFCTADTVLERLPGWDENSWGYHGDDGHSFTGSGTGKDYGPCYTTGDVVGCGVDFSEGVAFYTKNGSPLGVAFRDIPMSSDLYPCVGMRTPGEHITVNFGQEPFLFDITQYIKVGYTPTLSHPPAAPASSTSASTVPIKLILSYLVHHGYTSAARALLKDAEYAIQGEPDMAIDGTNNYQESESEMLKRQRDVPMDIDEDCFGRRQRRLSTRRSSTGSGTGGFYSSLFFPHEGSVEEEGPGEDASGAGMMLQRIMRFGQTLQDDYRHDERPKVRERLVEIFSLLAYQNLGDSPVSHLMDKAGRDDLATELNAAILGTRQGSIKNVCAHSSLFFFPLSYTLQSINVDLKCHL